MTFEQVKASMGVEQAAELDQSHGLRVGGPKPVPPVLSRDAERRAADEPAPRVVKR